MGGMSKAEEECRAVVSTLDNQEPQLRPRPAPVLERKDLWDEASLVLIPIPKLYLGKV